MTGQRPFATSIKRFVLLSYAAGWDVEGTWAFVDTDANVPDFVVEITRTNGGTTTCHSDVAGETALTGVEDFKTGLYDVLLGAYAAGHTVTGTWQLRYAPVALPEWELRIHRVGSERNAENDSPRSTN